MKPIKINTLPAKAGKKEIGQGVLDLGIEKDTEINGIGMGVLSDGTPYLNQRGLAALCGVQNAHIGYISAQWNDDPAKPRIQSIRTILGKVTNVPAAAHFEVKHKGTVHYCYPAEVCLAVLEYYAFDAGANCQPEARDKFPHRYPDSHPQSKSNPQESWCYPLAALGAYREWLQDVYIGGGKFRKYAEGKAKKGDFPPSVAQLAITAVETPLIGSA